MRYFLKEVVATKLYLPNGSYVPFEDVGGSYGIFQTAEPALIAELDKAIKNRVGGVIPLTEEEFTTWQKKKAASPSSSPSQPSGRQELQPIPFQQLQQLRAAGAAAVGSPILASPGQAAQQAQQQKVEPLSVPTAFTKPKVGRVPSKGAAPSPVTPLNAPPPASHVQGT